MDIFENTFEESQDNGTEISPVAVDQFKQLVISNGVLDDEELQSKWQLELEALIYNQKKFNLPQLLLFKQIVMKSSNVKLAESNFKQAKQQKNEQKIEIIKGDAGLFKKLQSGKKEKAPHNVIDGVMDSEDVFRNQIGKETMLDPIRFSYNNHLPQVQVETNKSRNHANMVINEIFTKYKPNKVPNYLNINLDKIRGHLERRITLFKERYYSQFLVGDEKFINDDEQFSRSSEVKMVGRIVSTEKGSLNTTNVRIELNKSQYYDLTFEDDFNFGNSIIFTNQIVMVTGLMNERGRVTVSELNTYPQKDLPISQEEQDSEQVQNLSSDDSQLILVAAGPFTSIMSNEYSAFDNILHVAKQRQVSTLILLGPFLDINNEILKDGQIIIEGKEYTFEQLQNSLFEKALQELGGQTQIIIVPSTRDILSIDSVPQQPLAVNVSRHAKSIHLQSNPAYFELQNELSIYIANSDIGMITLQNSLLDKKLPFSQQSKLVFKTLFNQNNLYTLYPMRNPTDSSKVLEIVKIPNINDFDIEFDQELGVFPKIVISPSSLPKFATNINNTIVINPNYTIRDGNYPGNFAMITYFKNSPLPIHQRIRVDFYSF